MALDDFAPAAELNGRVEESNLDEDLFDFPLMVSLEANAGQEEETQDEWGELPPEPVAEVTEPDPEPVAVAAPEPEPVAEAAPAPVEPQVITGLDPALDEDLFGFPPLELPAGASPAGGGTNLERGLDQATAAVGDLLEDDLGEMVEHTHREQLAAEAAAATKAAAQNAPAPAPPVPQSTVQPAPAPAPAPAADFSAAAAPIRPFTVPAGDPRIVWVLGGAVIVFMLGLLIVAWRATSNIGLPNGAAGGGVSETATNGESRNADAAAQQLAILQEMLRQQKLATQAALGAVASEGPPPLQRPHEITLAVAQESIDEGRFAEARRMLYGMLATAEQLPAEDRRQAEETAAYLLARSYRLEAGADPGEAR